MSDNVMKNFLVEAESFKVLRECLSSAVSMIFPDDEALAVKEIDQKRGPFRYRTDRLPVIFIAGCSFPKEAKDSNRYKPWTLFSNRPESATEAVLSHVDGIFGEKEEGWIANLKEKSEDIFVKSYLEKFRYEARLCDNLLHRSIVFSIISYREY